MFRFRLAPNLDELFPQRVDIVLWGRPASDSQHHSQRDSNSYDNPHFEPTSFVIPV